MTRINMTKYGFVRFPEGDFSDDGARFQCYKAGDIIVTKTTYQGEAFISGRSLPYDAEATLTYKEYSSLPHYTALDALNGVSVSSLTDEDLSKLYQNCLEYSKEWHAAADAIQYPTRTEVWAQLNCKCFTRTCELATVEKNLSAQNLLRMDEWQHSEFFRCLRHLAAEAGADLEDQVNQLMNTVMSRELVAKTTEQLKEPSYWYTRCMKLLGAE